MKALDHRLHVDIPFMSDDKFAYVPKQALRISKICNS